MQLGGIHHLTAVTAQVVKNHAFYTQVLGMRLVKKTVTKMMYQLTIFFTQMEKLLPVPILHFLIGQCQRKGVARVV